MSLSDTALKNAKPLTDKAYKLPIERGMYCHVQTNGAKYFRFDYRFNGKRKTLALGVYPDVSLKQAREKLNTARKQLAEDIDPGEIRREAKIAKANKFEQITRLWLATTAHQVGELTLHNKLQRFERHVFPVIGEIAVSEVKPSDISRLLQPLTAKKAYATAKRIRAEISAAFGYAIANNYAEYDPAQSITAQLIAPKTTHRAALTEPKDVAQLLRAIDSYNGSFVVQCAFKLSPLLFQRPGEIRQMKWKDISLETQEWRYLATKPGVQHIVPLSTQAIGIIEELRPATGNGLYVFPGRDSSDKTMSASTLKRALARLGYDSAVMTPHGFRTTASTLLNEQGWSPDAIERQLSHMPKDQVRRAYNRAQYLEERRRMMQAWADCLDGLKNGA